MTNKVVLRSVEEFMQDYVPTYQPIYPLFLGKSVAHSEEVGQVTFKRLEAIGNLRAMHVTPKDSEMSQVAASEASKVFKKYFLGKQYVQSTLQDRKGIEDVIAQVLDEHQKHQDDLLLLGEGTSASTMINNGLYWSADPNYELETSVEIDTDADSLIDMHAKIMANVADADALAGRKLILFYGADVLQRFDGVYAASNQPFKRVLADVLGPNYSLAKLPAAVTPASSNGWIIANLDQCKLHYSALPSVKDQGVNSEKNHTWHNFLMGSMMLEVLAENGIIRQPVTFEA